MNSQLKVMSGYTTKDEIVKWMEEQGGTVLEAEGGRGDTRLIWDPDSADEVTAARSVFDMLRRKNYDAFSVRRNGEPGELVREFDPNAAKIIMSPRIAGG